MPTNPSRAAAATRTSTDDAGDVQELPPSVLETALLVTSARLDNSVDPSEFRDMVEALIEAVRVDERTRSRLLVASTKRIQATRWITADDANKIRARAREASAGRNRLPVGFKAALAEEFGYTKSQIDQAIYEQGV